MRDGNTDRGAQDPNTTTLELPLLPPTPSLEPSLAFASASTAATLYLCRVWTLNTNAIHRCLYVWQRSGLRATLHTTVVSFAQRTIPCSLWPLRSRACSRWLEHAGLFFE